MDILEVDAFVADCKVAQVPFPGTASELYKLWQIAIMRGYKLANEERENRYKRYILSATGKHIYTGETLKVYLTKADDWSMFTINCKTYSHDELPLAEARLNEHIENNTVNGVFTIKDITNPKVEEL